MKQQTTFLLFSLVGALASFPILSQADLATVYLTNGQAQTVDLVGAEQGQVQWRAASGTGEVQATLRSQIEYVAFPTTEAWRNAEEAMESGNVAQAIPLYRQVIADPLSHYYPIPGNFVSLAKERLLRCYRIQMNVDAIAKQAAVVREEFLNLPPDYRNVDPVVAGWTALSKKDWEKVLTLLDLETLEAPGPEAFFLRGSALEALGRKPEAIQEYAGVYVMNFGGSIDLTKTALQRSSALLAEMNDENRMAELQAQVKLYRDLFGNGKLWEGASESLAKLADGEIVALGKAEGEMTKPDSAGGSIGGAVVAESGSLATLPSLEERKYILAEEIEERVFVVSTSQDKATLPILSGGVIEKDYGYAFDGTGGGIRIGGIDGNAPFMILRVRFNPAALDGIVVDLNDSKKGGFGLYLKGGEIILTWHPVEKKRANLKIGKVEVGKLANVYAVCRKDGTLVTIVDGEKQNHKVEAGGLRLGKNQFAAIGFAGTGKREGGTAIGEASIPFKGTVQHFSIGAGGSVIEIREMEVERFGKWVNLTPLPEADEEDQSKGDKEMPKEDAKEAPKEDSKAAPKEAPKVAPKGDPKAAPKE